MPFGVIICPFCGKGSFAKSSGGVRSGCEHTYVRVDGSGRRRMLRSGSPLLKVEDSEVVYVDNFAGDLKLGFRLRVVDRVIGFIRDSGPSKLKVLSSKLQIDEDVMRTTVYRAIKRGKLCRRNGKITVPGDNI